MPFLRQGTHRKYRFNNVGPLKIQKVEGNVHGKVRCDIFLQAAAIFYTIYGVGMAFLLNDFSMIFGLCSFIFLNFAAGSAQAVHGAGW